MAKTLFRVFIQKRKGRPKPVATQLIDKIPSTWEHDGQVYHFVTADLTAGTLTYSEIKPQAAVA